MGTRLQFVSRPTELPTMGFRNHVPLAVLVVVVFSMLFLDSASASALPRKLSQPGDLIMQLCRKTDYVDICIESVTANIKGKVTGILVLNAEIDASAKGTKAALALVAKLSRSASKEENLTLSVCKDNFESAVDSLTKAKKAIGAQDISSLNSELSAVITFVSTCDDAYVESSFSSPLKKVDERLMHQGSNCLAIANQISL